MMKTRDLWHKTSIRTSDRLHWNAYRFFRQEVKREIRLAEKAYVRIELQNSKGNSNEIWKVINRCLPRGVPYQGSSFENREPFEPIQNVQRVLYISSGKLQIIAQEFGFPPSGHDLSNNYANDVHENDH